MEVVDGPKGSAVGNTNGCSANKTNNGKLSMMRIPCWPKWQVKAVEVRRREKNTGIWRKLRPAFPGDKRSACRLSCFSKFRQNRFYCPEISLWNIFVCFSSFHSQFLKLKSPWKFQRKNSPTKLNFSPQKGFSGTCDVNIGEWNEVKSFSVLIIPFF